MKKETKKSLAVKGVISLILLILAIFLNILSRSDVFMRDYETVTVSVTDVDKYFGKSKIFNKVQVNYEGKEYRLKSMQSIYMYTEGQNITAYFADGKIYATVAGIQSDNIASDINVAVLVLFVISVIVFLADRAGYKKEKLQSAKFPSIKF